MLSWQSQYTMWGDLCSDADTTNLAQIGKVFIREGQRRLERELGIYFTQEQRTITTVTDAISGTSSQSYKLPENFKSLIDLYVTSGTTQYHAELVQDPERWGWMNSTTTSSTSNFLSHCFIKPDRIELFPIPSSTLTATLIYNSFSKPLVNDDYVTGTITSLANGAKAIIASGSTFTSAMVGRYFRIDLDGEWYKIAAFGTTTTLTLDTNYQGITIAADTKAYTIGQMPITPADTHELPVYYAVWKWALFKKDVQIAREYERMWKEGVASAKADWANRSSSAVIGGYGQLRKGRVRNPNFWPEGMA